MNKPTILQIIRLIFFYDLKWRDERFWFPKHEVNIFISKSEVDFFNWCYRHKRILTEQNAQYTFREIENSLYYRYTLDSSKFWIYFINVRIFNFSGYVYSYNSLNSIFLNKLPPMWNAWLYDIIGGMPEVWEGRYTYIKVLLSFFIEIKWKVKILDSSNL